MSYFSWANWWNNLIFSMLIWPIWSLDSRIELTIGINLFFAYWYNFMKKYESFRGWRGQKWLWPVMLWDFKIDCIWRMDRWNKMIFCMLIRFLNLKADQKCLGWCGQSGHGTLKLAVSSILAFCMHVIIWMIQ